MNIKLFYSIKVNILEIFIWYSLFSTKKMSSIIQFQVISGVYSDAPLCYLLQIDEYKFLLDCGWNENFSPEIIDEYKKYAALKNRYD
jgi:hypothetical protein